jgi:hypothetical protein
MGESIQLNKVPSRLTVGGARGTFDLAEKRSLQ